jgi:hypothetical protein
MLRWSARDAVDAPHRGAAGGWVRAVAATAALPALLATLSACASGAATVLPNEPASAPASSPAAGRSASPSPPPVHPGSSPPVVPVGGAPNIAVVRLSARFTPDTLRLGTGQKFEVVVSKSVKPSGSGIDGPCTPAAAARFSSSMLSLRCTGAGYLYTALRAGTTALAVSVRPDCGAGMMCPQWISEARLTLTIS